MDIENWRRKYQVVRTAILNTASVKLDRKKITQNRKECILPNSLCSIAWEKQGITVKKGYMLKSDGKYHEKGVDVRIAVDILRGALKNEYRRCFVISSDTDLIPAILDARTEKKEIIYVGFENFLSKALQVNCTRTIILDKKIINSCK